MRMAIRIAWLAVFVFAAWWVWQTFFRARVM